MKPKEDYTQWRDDMVIHTQSESLTKYSNERSGIRVDEYYEKKKEEGLLEPVRKIVNGVVRK